VVQRSQVDLPDVVGDAFEVYVNGVRQQPGIDFDQVGRTLVFQRELRKEGHLGFWRWTSIFLGVAGTYRHNDTVDVVYTSGSTRAVASLEPQPVEGDPADTV
jgi:hypothetical protein